MALFLIILSIVDLFEGLIDFSIYTSIFQLNEYTIGLYSLIIFLICWFYDVIIEGTYEGYHTFAVQKNLRLGFALFIVSEVMFFFAFFWAFFHACINPSIWIGEVWPPIGIIPLNPWSIPFANTVILLTSGLMLTWSHHTLINKISFFEIYPLKNISSINLINDLTFSILDRIELACWSRGEFYQTCESEEFIEILNTEEKETTKEHIFFTILTFFVYFKLFLFYFNAILTSYFVGFFKATTRVISNNARASVILSLILTISLGVLFSLLQRYEYIHALFTLKDGIYASTFYMLTGLHGLHVLIGSIFLFVCLIRHIRYHFTTTHHVGFESAIWYWHFVDVVWIFVFICIYWFGGQL
jgi:heme/copper-type cytochrome/quinol oxidase subunit 3